MSTANNSQQSIAPLALPPDASPTMSSREIAELVESRHDSVKRTIERLIERGTISQPPLVDGPKSANGVVSQEYLLGKRDSYVVVAQLSPEFTARLVDRWQELETAAAPPAYALPKNFSEALRQLADTVEVVSQQQAVITELTPKAFKWDAFVNADGLIGFQNAGRILGCRPGLFTRWLRVKHCFSQGGALIPRTEFVTAGYFVVKGEPGNDEVVRPRGWVTPKGMDYLASRVPPQIMIDPTTSPDGLPLFSRAEH